MPWELNIQNEISEVSKTSSTLSSCLLPVAASPACCLSPSWMFCLDLMKNQMNAENFPTIPSLGYNIYCYVIIDSIWAFVLTLFKK